MFGRINIRDYPDFWEGPSLDLSKVMRIIEPATPEQFAHYYQLRWEVLRQPWNQPQGSEKSEDENSAIHALLLNDQDQPAGVCRLHLATPEQAQLRYMAMHPRHQGLGLGHQLLAYLEGKAKDLGATTVMLQAREKAVRFYERAGYRVVEKTYLLFGEIQHYRMEKAL